VFKVYELLPAETLRALGFRPPGRDVRSRRKNRRKRRETQDARKAEAVVR